MGFYLRKSVKVGPLRFNFSKSGIGVSAGVRGLRIGTGPRGNYVHMGRHGLYYRQTLPSATRPSHPLPSLEIERQPAIPPNTHDPLRACSHRSCQASNRAKCEVAICFNWFQRPAL